jgi:hypothetical protein
VASLLKEVGQRAEGLTVAPASFGPLAGQIVLGVEGHDDDDPESGRVYALDADASLVLLADIGYAAEDLQFVPPNGGTYYQCQIAFDRERKNRLLAASSSQFLSRLGHLSMASGVFHCPRCSLSGIVLQIGLGVRPRSSYGRGVGAPTHRERSPLNPPCERCRKRSAGASRSRRR